MTPRLTNSPATSAMTSQIPQARPIACMKDPITMSNASNNSASSPLRTPNIARHRATCGLMLFAGTALAASVLGGCATSGPHGLPAVDQAAILKPEPAPGMVAEILAEGPSADFDGVAEFGRHSIVLTDRAAEDFAAISDLAIAQGDQELALAATLTYMGLCLRQDHGIGYLMLARLIEEVNTGLAIAMADNLPDWITLDEGSLSLDPNSAAVTNAVLQRARRVAASGATEYENENCWWCNEDERVIMHAMILLLEADRLAQAGGAQATDLVTLRSVISDCEGDLWDSQVQNVRSAFKAATDRGLVSMNRALRRSAQAIDLAYEGITPEIPTYREPGL